ncbi:hypothetical protein [Actinoplanes sp. NPDC049265]|uniref:hypothetical protein n=1 Tax=Actinoplanes sp. NPDC049265 TaxID=3363902 RepID=UPI00371817A9
MIVPRRLLAVPVALVLAAGGYLVSRPADAPSAPPATPVVSPPAPSPSPASPPVATPPAASDPSDVDDTTGSSRPDSRPGPAASRPTPARSHSPTPAPPRREGGDGPGVASLDKALERHDPVPAGVADQISVFTGGGTSCLGLLPEPLSVGVTDVRSVPAVPVICVHGFADTDLTLTVTTPSGRPTTITRPGTSDGFDNIDFRLGPGSETGKYVIRADQNKETAFTELKIERPSAPTIWVNPEHAAPGETVEVLIGGFPPGQPARLHLYVCESKIRYRTTLTTPVNAAGEARLALSTSPNTPATCYVVLNPAVYDPLAPTAGSLPPHLLFWVD